jgi:hypothetical protein
VVRCKCGKTHQVSQGDLVKEMMAASLPGVGYNIDRQPEYLIECSCGTNLIVRLSVEVTE